MELDLGDLPLLKILWAGNFNQLSDALYQRFVQLADRKGKVYDDDLHALMNIC